MCTDYVVKYSPILLAKYSTVQVRWPICVTFLHGYKTATIAYIAEVIIGSCDLIATPAMSLLDEGHLSTEGVLTGNEWSRVEAV